MIIKNKLGMILDSIENWKNGFIAVDHKPMHWKTGRSAESLAWYFISGGGEKHLREIFDEIFPHASVNFDDAQIEYECPFDNCGKGRMQDLATWGTVNGSPFFVGLEAKVDEPFGDVLYAAFSKASHAFIDNPKSKAVKRIVDLVNEYGQYNLNLPYQLLHYLAGSLAEGRRRGAKYVLMPVFVFDTSSIDKKMFSDRVADENKDLYIKFLNELKFKKIKKSSNGLYFSKKYGDIEVITIYSKIKR